ncbi:MAG: hypothetical protein IPG22_07445 [Acidobacteria bacterium]|nr:hypothetical protein [Acidobacteriota bacterium]
MPNARKAYYAENREKIVARQKAYYGRTARDRRPQRRGPETKAAYAKEYYAANRERLIAYQRESAKTYMGK